MRWSVLASLSVVAFFVLGTGCTSLLGKFEVEGDDGGSDATSDVNGEAGPDSPGVTGDSGGDTGDSGGVTKDSGGDTGMQGEAGQCTSGTACTPTNPCHTGTTQCTNGVSSCKDTGNVSNGTKCGTNEVCDNGTCSPCTAGTTCTPTDVCHTGKTDCSTGASVCMDTGMPGVNGTSCGTGQVCESGTCTTCTNGAACVPTANPCDNGSLDCSGSTPSCTDKGTQANNGTACGTDMVCNGGQCVACTAGGSCTLANPCLAGTYDCSTGTQQCVSMGNANDTTSCGTNAFCCSGTCDMGCPVPPNAGPTCSGTTCGYACNSGYVPCNGGCIPSAPNTTAGVFVAPGGAGGACGSESQPCGTIALGLSAISSSAGTKNIIYLANGTYTEQVTLPSGITIQGGWLDTGGTWTAQCVANPETGAVIQAPAGTTTTVIASYSGTSTLDTLTIASISSAATGQSLFGINANGTGTALVLDTVDINMAAGGAGGSGSTGSAGTNGTGNCATPSNGANGGAGSNGAGASAGTYTAAGGYAPNSGGPASGGGNGNCGTTPAGQVCMSVTDPCVDDGSGSGMCITESTNCCNTAGHAGNPGTGSGPGTPGSGGGSSVAIFVSGASVTLNGGKQNPGAGGNGGNGGAGGIAGTGNTGLAGTAGTVGTTCGPVCHSGICDCTISAKSTCEPAGLGTKGGNGGTGGSAGGGSGGDSYCWYVFGGSGTVTPNGNTCTPQTAGLGGSQGGSSLQGANGNAGTHN